MRRVTKASLAVALLLLACSGCAKRRGASIVNHPNWEYQDYQRVAVLPFRCARPEAAEAARQAELHLIDQLSANGAFQVATRSDLSALMTEQDLSNLAGVADPSTAPPQGMVQVAQALIIGTITDFDLQREQRERSVPIIRLDRNGVPRVVGERRFMEYRHVARLGGNVRVVDAATGRVLVSHSLPPIEKDDAQANAPPRATPEELALDLAQELATEFCRKIAPQQVNVKLDSDCLIIASGYFEGRYEELKKVPTSLPEILLVARDLPKACDRNQFRLAISPKDGREYLVEHEFTWSPTLGHRGEIVQVPVSKLTAAGGERFVAKLFSIGNDRPILERDFSLVPPKKVD